MVGGTAALELIMQFQDVLDWISYGRNLITVAQSANSGRLDTDFAISLLGGLI
jgi:hypothetical protein